MKLSPVRRTPDLSHITVGITRPIKKRKKADKSKELRMKTDDNQTHLAGGDCQFPWQPSQQGTKNSMTYFQPVIHEPCHTCSPLTTEETHNIFSIIIQKETDQRLAD
jgi:hypothetical protein